MIFVESFRSGLQAIMANRMRSALTMLGIMIGVAAVISLVAFGQGASNSVSASIQGLGTNLLTVIPDNPNRPGQVASTSVQDLTVEDAIALTDPLVAPDIAAVAPVKAAGTTCTLGSLSHDTQIYGTWPSYFQITNSVVDQGVYLQNLDVQSARRVAVIGVDVANELFPGEEPLGKEIQCSGVPFTVVGVLQQKGGGGFSNPDDVVLAPLTTVENTITGYGALSNISVQGQSSDRIESTESQVTAVLDERHNTTEESRDFRIFNQASILETANEALGVFTILLGAVAAISLLVGGIGITNIMLVSVTERTREIGIRKAIGASRRFIMLQFLMEATVLSLIGAVAGVILASSVTLLNVAGIQPTIVPASVVGAFVISVGIGLFFGSWPARRAASLRPIEALRHE